MATGIGSGLNEAVTKMFLTTDASTGAVTGLSNMGGLTAVFGGIRTYGSWLNDISIPLGY